MATKFLEPISPASQPSYLDLEACLLKEIQADSGDDYLSVKSDPDQYRPPPIEFGLQDPPNFHEFVWPPATTNQQPIEINSAIQSPSKIDPELTPAELKKYITLLEDRVEQLHT